ncbi:MAG: oligosaccharide flippase family protein [bacterium]|nr:oligosaccharide flippase family protein [bacterium]
MQPLRERLYAALRWSEKYTKTDMVYLFRGSFWSTVAQIGTAACTFALAIIVSRYVPKEVYGTYKYVFALVGVLSTFSLTGLPTAVFQSVAAGFDGALHEGFWKNIRWSVLIFIASPVVAGYYFVLHNPTLAFGILIAGCLSPFLTSANLAGSFLGGKKDFYRQSLYFGLWGSGIPIVALIGAIFVSTNPLWLVIVFCVANTASSLYFYKRTLEVYHPDPAKKDPGMMTYGKHLSLLGVLGGIAGNLDQILLFHYVGAAELAIYNFATAILDQTGGPLKTVTNMITSKYATHTDKNIRENIWNKVWWLFLLGAVIAAVYIPLAPFIYAFLFPAYVDAVPYSQIYALSILSVVFSPFGAYLTAKKKIKEQYIGSIFNYCLQIAVMAVAVIGWGLWGLIIARVLLRTFGSLPTLILYRSAIGHE